MAHPTMHSTATSTTASDADGVERGKTDLVSALYVAGGIPAIVGFLFLLFAIGVRFCGLPG